MGDIAIVLIALGMLMITPAMAQPQHGIAMNGTPALSPDFAHLPYANPDAPKGGRAVFGETGGFDSLNPYVLKGTAPWPVRVLSVESLMARSFNEPFTLYGLLAETVETPPDRSWVEYTLREGARFSDGSPVTVEDVIWSIQTLGTEGHPRYRSAWSSIEKIEAIGTLGVRIAFKEPNRELPLILGLRPVLKKAQWTGRTFGDAGLEAVTGSGPYVIDSFEPGRQITFRKDPEWWGVDLAVNRGLHNFEELRFDYFRNTDALWEAVRAGQVSIHADYDPVRWVEGYDFPAAREGTLLRGEIAHQRPSGMEGLVFNTRRRMFADRQVREALALSFDWEWINARLYRDQFTRISSYFANSALAFEGPAEGHEAAVLAPFEAELPKGSLEAGWRPPVSNGSGRDRRNLRRAARLLDAAGWTITDGVRRDQDGAPFVFEILVHKTEHETLANLWREQLTRLGIDVSVRLVDAAQYSARRTAYDYDMIVNRWGMSLSPGTEQRLYFGSAGRETPGTRNYMGVAEPAVDAAIDAILASETSAEFTASVRALDRVLSAGIYVIPFGILPTDRVAWRRGFARPDVDSLYGWWGWWSGPALWWHSGEVDQ